MKRLLLITLLTCLFSSAAFAQDNSQPKAWKIIMKRQVKPLPGASQDVMKEAKEFNSHNDSLKTRVIISDSLYVSQLNLRYNPKSPIHIILNRRDSVMYGYFGNGKTAYRAPFEIYFKLTSKRFQSTNIQYFDTAKTILGLQVQKLKYEVAVDTSKSETTKVIVWYAPNIPSWMLMSSKASVIPGYPLKTITVMNNKIKMISKAVSINRITLEKSDYYPPKGYKIVEKGLEDNSN